MNEEEMILNNNKIILKILNKCDEIKANSANQFIVENLATEIKIIAKEGMLKPVIKEFNNE